MLEASNSRFRIVKDPSILSQRQGDSVVAGHARCGEQFDPANGEIVIRWTHENSKDTGEWRET